MIWRSRIFDSDFNLFVRVGGTNLRRGLRAEAAIREAGIVRESSVRLRVDIFSTLELGVPAMLVDRNADEDSS